MDHTKFKPFFKIIPIVLLIGLFALLAGTSSPVMNDPFTGHYYVYGSKIVYSGGWFSSGYTVIDTVNFASVVTVKYMEEKSDTLHFFGMPGADEGERRFFYGRQRNDHMGSFHSYNNSDYYKLYGSLSDKHFEINMVRPSGRYYVTGTISNRTIEIQGEYSDRGTKVEYDLVGEKIE